MRTRLLPTVLGLTVMLGGTVALAAPAGAAPAPVEIAAPVAAHAYNGNVSPGGDFVGDPALQKFVAANSGHLTTITATYGGSFAGSPVELYSDDQVSLGAASGLTNVVADLYVGAPLGTATLPAGSGETASATFTSTASLVAGQTYWVLIDHAAGISGSFPATTSGYYSPGGANFTSVNANFAFDIDTGSVVDPVGVTLDPPTATGDHGWYTGDVTATYTCLATVDSCPDPATVTADGANRLEGTVTLNSGATSFSWFHTVKIDRTAPIITGTAKATVNGIKVTWTCSDAASGIQSCPSPTVVTGIGSDTVATAEARDVAGNTAMGTVSGLTAAAHGPSITIHGVVANKTYAHGTKVTPTCTATTTLSSVARKGNSAPATVTCTGTSTKKANKNGSVAWTYKATAVDTHALGGTSTKSVSWTIAAKAKAKPVATFVVHGLPSKTKDGYPVIDHRKSYDLSFTIKDKNGKVLKGKPTWLHSVKTNKAGTKGKPTKKMDAFTKVKGVWTMDFTPGYDYAGHYRKFGVIAPNGKRYYVVIYVK